MKLKLVDYFYHYSYPLIHLPQVASNGVGVATESATNHGSLVKIWLGVRRYLTLQSSFQKCYGSMFVI